MKEVKIQTDFTTKRTDRTYRILWSPVSLYAGTYDLPRTTNDISNSVAESLDYDNSSTDYHPDQLDFDHSEITAYALLYLTQFNRTILSVKRI